ncbi:MAG: SGNH/GDSL hydrolase family protein [Candidatus Thermoplasmatota archaeon]|nr:SGNH/GDSL hydrolase family protein [Candidatus Thermoplasmatota archaeon]
MGRRRVLLIVASLLAVSWSISIPVHATDARGSEGGSILFEQKIFGSDEPLEASIGLWGLTLGRNYELHWTVHATNVSSSIGPSTAVSTGVIPFFANQSATQIELSEYHVANESMMYYLEIGLNSSTGWTDVSAIAPFSVFRTSIAPQYTDMYVFGDSLSDSGNTYSAFGTPESPPYWQGRYSEGKNWVDFTQDWLGGSNVAGRGGSAGNNRAFGGAATGNGMTYWVIENIGKQVDDWDQNYNLGSADAVAIWGGGNDLINYGETNAQNLVDNLEEHAEQLISAGGQEFIFFELPPLEKTPSASSKSAQEKQELGQRVVDFNTGMYAMTANLAQTYGVVTHMIPVWEGFEMLYWSGPHFGITNVTHSACDHDGATCDSNDPIAPNVEEYIFFDSLHPTQTTHRAVSLFVQQMVGIADYDGDNVADYMDICPHTMPWMHVGTDGCEIPPPDTDEDGVIDDEDMCPNTDVGLTVDENGCATNQLDGDSDGVMDNVDLCPNTQPGWEVNSDGCSSWEIDSDEDGNVDAEDDCPNTIIGEDVDGDGCADYQLDTDDDGVSDDLDACPRTPREELVNEIGCSGSQLDDDGDGIYNFEDSCPDTPLVEDVDSTGCGPSQRDTDEDGVNDDVDQCPDTEWLEDTDGNGCAANQRDSDGDGRKDSVDGCPLIFGTLNGCPVLSVEMNLVSAPDDVSRTANISITISCESGCLMDWKIEDTTQLISQSFSVSNGTYSTPYTNLTQESEELTARVSIEGWWKDTVMTVYFPPIVEDTPEENETGGVEQNTGNGPSSAEGEKETESGLDSGSIAFIAMLLLLNVGIIAAIMAVRSKSKKKRDGRERAMASFERDLFADSGPVGGTPAFQEISTPEPVSSQGGPPIPVGGLPPGWTAEQWNHYGAQWLAQQATSQPAPEPVVTKPSTIDDLPNIEDLLG